MKKQPYLVKAVISISLLFIMINTLPSCTAEDLSFKQIQKRVESAIGHVATVVISQNASESMRPISDASNSGVRHAQLITSSEFDFLEKRCHKSLSVETEVRNLQWPTSIHYATDEYTVDGWTYYEEIFDDGGYHWTKLKKDFPEYNVLSLSGDALQSAGPTAGLEQGDLDGVACYVIATDVPTGEGLTWLRSQTMVQLGDAELSMLSEESITSFTVTLWISKKSMLPLKTVTNVTFDAVPPAIAVPDGGSVIERYEMDVASRLFNYDAPLSITLPDEAQNAPEIMTK